MIWFKKMPLFKILPIFGMLLLLFVGALSSCGYDKSYEGTEESLYFSQDALNGGVPLTDSQMAVALRVCYAFRTKRSKFSLEMMGEGFVFNHTTRDCSSDETTTTINSVLVQDNSNEPLRYDSSFTGSYVDEVQTDIHGYLFEVCADVLAGETPLNTIETNNELFEYSFNSSIAEGDQVVIQIGSARTPDSEVPSVTQKVILDILTNATSSGNYQGMVVEAKRYSPCSIGSTEVKLIKQVFQAP